MCVNNVVVHNIISISTFIEIGVCFFSCINTFPNINTLSKGLSTCVCHSVCLYCIYPLISYFVHNYSVGNVSHCDFAFSISLRENCRLHCVHVHCVG